MFFLTRPSPERSSFHELLSRAFSSGELIKFSIRKIEDLIMKGEKPSKEIATLAANMTSFRNDQGISPECSEKIKNLLLKKPIITSIVSDYASKSGLLEIAWYSWQIDKQVESITERLLAHLWWKIIRNRVISVGNSIEQQLPETDSIVEMIVLGTVEKTRGIILVHGWRYGEQLDDNYLLSGKFLNIFPDVFEHDGMPHKKVRLENGKYAFVNLVDGSTWDEYDFIGQPQLSHRENNNHTSILLSSGLTGKQSITFTAFRDGKQLELPFSYEFPHVTQKTHHSH